MNDIQYFAKIKGSPEPAKPIGWSAGKQSSVPVKGLLQYKPSTFKGLLQYKPSTFEFSLYYRKNHRMLKEVRAFLLGYARVSGIKRTRKRGIEKAKFMDHTSYEWSQWWKKKARKPKRWR